MGTFKVSLHSLFSNSQAWVISSHLSSSVQSSFERFFDLRVLPLFLFRVKTSTDEKKQKPPVQQS
ncbi:hypothetical protein ACE6H2_019150 [Prunus campanulata]